jgi:hypothetical protein
MSRPTKLTPARREQILGAVRAGCYRGLAARTAGVAEATLYRWLADPRPRYREFREAVERAAAEAEAEAVGQIVAAGRRDWHAAHVWLQAHAPGIWGRRAGEVTVEPPPLPPPVPQLTGGDVVFLSPEQLQRIGLDILHMRRLQDGSEEVDLEGLSSGPDDEPP